MWIRHLLLIVTGLGAGVAVAAASFAFITMLGIIPRMIGKSRTAQEIYLYENMVVLGGIAGNLVSVFVKISLPLGDFAGIFFCIYGLATGIFVGTVAAALEEVVQTFPIISRRISLNSGMNYVVAALAVSKTVGAFFYFLRQLGS